MAPGNYRNSLLYLSDDEACQRGFVLVTDVPNGNSTDSFLLHERRTLRLGQIELSPTRTGALKVVEMRADGYRVTPATPNEQDRIRQYLENKPQPGNLRLSPDSLISQTDESNPSYRTGVRPAVI